MPHLYLSAADTVWLMVATIWTVFSIAMLATYHTARRAALSGPYQITDPDVRVLAREIMRDFTRAESIRLASHLVAIVIGLAGAVITPRHPNEQATIADTAIVVGLVVLNCLSGANSVNAYFSWKRRGRLVNKDDGHWISRPSSSNRRAGAFRQPRKEEDHMSDQLRVAIIRGAYDAIGTGAAAVLALMAQGAAMRTALITGGVLALASLGFRGGVEGAVDTSKALTDLEARVAAVPPPVAREERQ